MKGVQGAKAFHNEKMPDTLKQKATPRARVLLREESDCVHGYT